MHRFAILLGIKFLPVGLEDALKIVVDAIEKKDGSYFCLADMHVTMKSQRDYELKEILNSAAGVFPDGMGPALALKYLGYTFKGRVRGTDLMLKLCEYANKNKLKIFLYGNTTETLNKLSKKLLEMYPDLIIAGAIAPPFRELTKEEDEYYVSQINEADPDILFVSLGAPKQEKWMAQHKGRIKAIQLGVGAAFDFITGNVKQAPVWMQRIGLEWLYRLPQQPRKTLYRISFAPEFILKTLLERLRMKTEKLL